MATISTQNGSKLSQEHNRRLQKLVERESHINPNGKYEIWIDEAIRKAYDRIYGQAVEMYNAKQERQERKIKNYYNKIRDDQKKHVAYEMIIGVYGKDVKEEQSYEILKEFTDTWKDRNPNLELIGAYYHADEEGQPHVHLDYIPVAKGYKRGLEVQNGLNKALEQQGFKGKSKNLTPQILWEKRENMYLEELCKQRGIEIEHPMRDNIKHMETKIYKLVKELEKVEEQILGATKILTGKELTDTEKSFLGKKKITIEQYNDFIKIANSISEVSQSIGKQYNDAEQYYNQRKSEADDYYKQKYETANSLDNKLKEKGLLKEIMELKQILELVEELKPGIIEEVKDMYNKGKQRLIDDDKYER